MERRNREEVTALESWYRNMDRGFYTYVTTIMKGLGAEYEPWYGDQLTVGKRDWYNLS